LIEPKFKKQRIVGLRDKDVCPLKRKTAVKASVVVTVLV
jgi:hypothetical protein